MVNMSSSRRSDSPTQLLKTKTKSRVTTKSESMKHVTEMERSHNLYRAYSLRDDKNSDFTVLDLHKENDEALQDILTDGNSVRASGNSMHYKRSNSHRSFEGDSGKLKEAVASLDLLLQKEKNLCNRTEIFKCLGVLQSITGTGHSELMNGVNGRYKDTKTKVDHI